MLDSFIPPEILGHRIRLRKVTDADLEPLVASQVDPEIRRYLGGPRSEESIRAFIEEVGLSAVTQAAGSFVVADGTSDRMLGTVSVEHRSADLPGHVTAAGEELELSYLLLPHAWGFGYATEASQTLLSHLAKALPDQPVVIVTQSANGPSLAVAARLGFTVVETFEQYNASQTLLTARLSSFRQDRPTTG